MAGNDNSLMTLSELIGREPPYMIDAERAILAAVLVEPALFTEVMQIIRKPEYFYDEYIRGLYSCCYWLESQGKPIDLVTVIDQAVETGVFTTQEMARNYLKQLLDGFITKGNVADYCRIIEDKYYVRTLIDVSTELIKRASEKNVKSDELLDLAEQMIYDIRSGKFANGLLPLETVIMDVYDHLQELTGADRDKFKGISTGFSSIGGASRYGKIRLCAERGGECREGLSQGHGGVLFGNVAGAGGNENAFERGAGESFGAAFRRFRTGRQRMAGAGKRYGAAGEAADLH